MPKSCRPLVCAVARAARFVPLALCVLLLGACAAARGPEAARPRTSEPAYPIILGPSEERREQAAAAWQALAQEQGFEAAQRPELQAVTSTINALPANVALRLPKVEIAPAAAATQDEATREALRRFLTSAAPLVGVATKDLSLVEIRDVGAGVQLARYRQNPFPYPLRGSFGVVELRFTADGHVNALTSTALPDTERLARALAAQPQKLTAQDAEARLKGRVLTYPGIGNSTLSYTVGPNDEVKARELVVYPLRRAGDAAALELHLAWEVAVGSGPEPLVAYVDAVTADVIAAEATATQKVQPK